MAQKTRFLNEFDPFKNYQDVTIENLKDEKWRTLAEELMGETQESRQQGIQTLKELALRDNLVLPFPQDETLNDEEKDCLEQHFWLMFLRSGEMNPEEALKVLKNYLSMMKDRPQYFEASYSPYRLDMIYQQMIQIVLEHRDQYGRRVLIYKPGNWNPDRVHFNDVFGGGYALCELMSLETKTQVAGVTVVADAKDFGFKQLRNLTIDGLCCGASIVQDSFPLWFRDIHVVNAARFFYLAYNMVKPFLNERVRNSIQFHDSLETLHQHVPKEILPTELGGPSGSYNNSACAQATIGLDKHFSKVKTFVSSNDIRK